MIDKLSKEDIKFLEDEGYILESEDPFSMYREAQFAGGIHELTSIEEALEEIRNIKVAKDFYKWLHRKKDPESGLFP